MFWNSITGYSMYNILFMHVRNTDILKLSHVTPCTILCFNIHVRYTDVLNLYHVSHRVQYSVLNIHVRYTDVLNLYHMSLRVQCSVSIIMWDIQKFWNSITRYSMYNFLFHYTCEIYRCSESVSHITPCTIFYFQYAREVYRCSESVSYVTPCTMFCFNIHVRYTDFLNLYHISLHVKYSVSIYTWDIQMLWICITCHSVYNILFQYSCEIYKCSETLSHITPSTIFSLNNHVIYRDVLNLYHMSLRVKYSVAIYRRDLLMLWNCVTVFLDKFRKIVKTIMTKPTRR